MMEQIAVNRQGIVLLGFVLAFAACGGSTGHRKGSQGAAGSDAGAGNTTGETLQGGAAGASGKAGGAAAGGKGGTVGDGGTGRADGGASEPRAGSAGEATVEGALDITRLQISSCTSRYGADTAELPQLLTGRDPQQYRGLECVAWDLTDAKASIIDFVNFHTPDDFDSDPSTDLWHEAARQDEDGVLRITREWDSEYVSLGMGCDRSLSFAIAEVAFEESLRLKFLTRNCSSCGWATRATLDISAATRPTGIVCRHLRDNYVGQVEVDPPEYALYAGSFLRPSAGGVCNEGLVPWELEPGWEICAAPCSEEATECPLPELLSCQDSICELTETL